jgi:DNA-binding PadR family transcriptional regulator
MMESPAEARRAQGGRRGEAALPPSRPGRGSIKPEMPAEHALLGLIMRQGGEAHGYELARHFESPSPLSDVLRLEQAMLYQHLKKLERQGWLSVTVQLQQARPPRRVYRITPDGKTELRRWLTEPVTHTREIRLEFLVKLFFALTFDAELADRLIREQLARCEQLAALLQAQIAALEAREERDVQGCAGDFERLVLELRRDQTLAAAAWLERVANWNRTSPR